MNLNGRSVPCPHPDWGECADELLFHTSRYAGYTARRLRELGACHECDLAGFRAIAMSPVQRACMACLLARPPEAGVANAVAALAASVATGKPVVPRAARKLVGKRHSRPHRLVTPSRPDHSTGLATSHPFEVLLHLGTRYGFSVVLSGGHVWLNDRRLARLLHRKGSREARNVLEALEALRSYGYQVHLPDTQGARSRRRLRYRDQCRATDVESAN